MDVLARLCHVFRVPLFVSPRVRALKKMPKACLWDPTLVADEGPRFEGLVASHLLKLCHLLEDRDGHATALHDLRGRDGREVDFLVTLNRKAWFAVEAKLSATRADPSLVCFKERLRIPWAYQVTRTGPRDFVEDGVRTVPASRFLPALGR